MRTRPPLEAADYYLRQGTDADALASELATVAERTRYIATFYTSRFWAHPGAFDADAVTFHAEPYGRRPQAAGVVPRLRVERSREAARGRGGR